MCNEVFKSYTQMHNEIEKKSKHASHMVKGSGASTPTSLPVNKLE